MDRHRRSRAGFTLTEIMVVVAIIGILAAVAVPTFMKHVKKARTSEAKLNVERIYNGGKAYYTVHAMFALRGSAWVPASRACAGNNKPSKHLPSAWVESAVWEELNFQMNDPFRMQYNYVGAAAKMQAIARGDLDCDNTFSTFNQTATQKKGRFTGGVLTVTSPNE